MIAQTYHLITWTPDTAANTDNVVGILHGDLNTRDTISKAYNMLTAERKAQWERISDTRLAQWEQDTTTARVFCPQTGETFVYVGWIEAPGETPAEPEPYEPGVFGGAHPGDDEDTEDAPAFVPAPSPMLAKAIAENRKRQAARKQRNSPAAAIARAEAAWDAEDAETEAERRMAEMAANVTLTDLRNLHAIHPDHARDHARHIIDTTDVSAPMTPETRPALIARHAQIETARAWLDASPAPEPPAPTVTTHKPLRESSFFAYQLLAGSCSNFHTDYAFKLATLMMRDLHGNAWGNDAENRAEHEHMQNTLLGIVERLEYATWQNVLDAIARDTMPNEMLPQPEPPAPAADVTAELVDYARDMNGTCDRTGYPACVDCGRTDTRTVNVKYGDEKRRCLATCAPAYAKQYQAERNAKKQAEYATIPAIGGGSHEADTQPQPRTFTIYRKNMDTQALTIEKTFTSDDEPKPLDYFDWYTRVTETATNELWQLHDETGHIMSANVPEMQTLKPKPAPKKQAKPRNQATSQKRDNQRAQRAALNEAYKAHAAGIASEVSDILTAFGFTIISTKDNDGTPVTIWQDTNPQEIEGTNPDHIAHATIKQTPYSLRIYNGQPSRLPRHGDAELINRMEHGWCACGDARGYAAGLADAILRLIEVPDPLMEAIDALEAREAEQSAPLPRPSAADLAEMYGSVDLDLTARLLQAGERNAYTIAAPGHDGRPVIIAEVEHHDIPNPVLIGGQPSMSGPWEMPAISGGSEDAECSQCGRLLINAPADNPDVCGECDAWLKSVEPISCADCGITSDDTTIERGIFGDLAPRCSSCMSVYIAYVDRLNETKCSHDQHESGARFCSQCGHDAQPDAPQPTDTGAEHGPHQYECIISTEEARMIAGFWSSYDDPETGALDLFHRTGIRGIELHPQAWNLLQRRQNCRETIKLWKYIEDWYAKHPTPGGNWSPTDTGTSYDVLPLTKRYTRRTLEKKCAEASAILGKHVEVIQDPVSKRYAVTEDLPERMRNNPGEWLRERDCNTIRYWIEHLDASIRKHRACISATDFGYQLVGDENKDPFPWAVVALPSGQIIQRYSHRAVADQHADRLRIERSR